MAGAGARRDDEARCCHELVREIRPDKPTCRRIVGPVVRSHGTNFVVVGECNIAEVLWVEGDLEKVREATVRSAAEAARRDRATMDDMVADQVRDKKWPWHRDR